MSRTYEISTFDSNTPFKCTVHQIGHIHVHMHDYFEIIFVLSGSCNITVDDRIYHMEADDILAIELHTPHELRATDCVYISVQMDQTTLENHFAVPMHPKFECNSQIPGNEEAFQQMRHTIALMVKNNADRRTGYELRNWIYVFQLMEILFTHFRVERSLALDKRTYRYAARMDEIARIIKDHYTDDLTLSQLADMVHLSSPYLSKFFMEQFGVNFLTYLTQVRINHALHDLLHTEKNMEEISQDSGFPNSHAFTQAFKKEFGQLPSAYRRTQRQSQAVPSYTMVQQSSYMAGLKKHLHEENQMPISIPSVSQSGTFSVLSQGKSLTHTWRTIASVGQASDILNASIQKCLIQMQHDIGFTYLFFTGIFSDSMYFYLEDDNNKPHYNFIYIDQIFDFLLSVGLKPFLSLSYMPVALAEQPSHKTLEHLTSMPKSLPAWRTMVETFFSHIIRRYGNAEVLSWKYTIWHLPDTPSRIFGFDNPEVFYHFYQYTCETVKGIHKDFSFGLPCTFYLNDSHHSDWYLNFLDWCLAQDCPPDFICFTFFDVKLGSGRTNSRTTFGFFDPLVLNQEENGLENFLYDVHKSLKAKGVGSLPLYICEWNNTPSQQDLLNDTCYKSCYIIKSILRNYDNFDGLAYWSLSDLMSESPVPDLYLFGGLGLFSVDGIPKAAYYALAFLGLLKDRFLAKGDSWFATRSDDTLSIIACHYKHITHLYALGERFDMSETDRYTMFEPSESLCLQLEITGLADGEHEMTEYTLNRKNGSLYDTWADWGVGTPSSNAERTYLKAKSVPFLHKSKTTVKNGTLNLFSELSLLEVKVIQITL